MLISRVLIRVELDGLMSLVMTNGLSVRASTNF